MYRKLFLSVCLVLLTAVLAMAEDAGQDKQKKSSAAKELAGMSIVGNDEAPKSLYIVPWKSSELGVETSLQMLANSGDTPLDREVFQRHLAYYQISIAKSSDTQ